MNTNELRRRLGLAADAATATPSATVADEAPSSPVYASAAEERYHTFGITR